MSELPKSVFKYYGIAYSDVTKESRTKEYIRSLLHAESYALYYNKPYNFNDPFDSRPNFSLVHDEAHVKDVLIRTLASQPLRMQYEDPTLRLAVNDTDQWTAYCEKESRNYWNDSYDRLLVFCVSENHPAVSLAMWGHYGNNHYGFCVEFDSELFDFPPDTPTMCNLVTPAPYGSYGQAPLFKVNYSDPFAKIGIAEYANKDIPIDQARLQAEIILGTKSKDWSWEREWRSVAQFHSPVPSGKMFFIKGQDPLSLIKAVYCGYRMDPSLVRFVKDCCRTGKGIPVYEIRGFAGDEFRLEYHRTA